MIVLFVKLNYTSQGKCEDINQLSLSRGQQQIAIDYFYSKRLPTYLDKISKRKKKLVVVFRSVIFKLKKQQQQQAISFSQTKLNKTGENG